MSTLLVMRDLCIRAPHRTLVDGVDVEVQAGKVTAVVGHSGSGKSLSARACMCVLDVEPGLSDGGEWKSAGAGYVFNDLMDLDADRAHPKKCLRPFAAAHRSPAQPGPAPCRRLGPLRRRSSGSPGGGS